jgi:carbamate kinase
MNHLLPLLLYNIPSNSFDVLGAESIGQIGYVLAQALSSAGCTTAPIICQVVVDPQHEAFRDPSKFVGPI